MCYKCGEHAWPHPRCIDCPAFDHICDKCNKKGHRPSVCKSGQTAVKCIQPTEHTELQQEPHIQAADHSTLYFCSATEETNVLQTVPVAKLTSQEQGEHIRPLYYSKSLNSTPHQITCEVDISAGCNVMPLHVTQKLYNDQE